MRFACSRLIEWCIFDIWITKDASDITSSTIRSFYMQDDKRE